MKMEQMEIISQEINEDTVLSGNVITDGTDDSDPDSDTILEITQFTFTSGTTTYTFPAGTTATIPNVGTIVVNANGSYTFTPNSNWNGSVPVISYTLSDSDGGKDIGDLTITVSAVNDDPVAFTFTPELNYNGTLPTITYVATDNSNGTDAASLNITISPLNDNPIAQPNTNTLAEDDTNVTGNVLTDGTDDSDVDGNTLTVSQFTINGVIYNPGTVANIDGVGTIQVDANGAYEFIPIANYNGTVPTINYTISDGAGGTATSTLILTVSPVNDAPVARNDSQTGAEDATLSQELS
ncbi:hypothetical protein GHT06_004509 [Daphnia sinensis]|uniref:Tandem-95 repeat protein n=1 Tax=Daphnia sinensis TaxID=1820382 RepID=A0AAD5KE74_9CRUS|nr:hypothetical protein GHT06_004509 [Daphnia sinensis]